MPITATSSDPETLTLTVVGDYDVPVARLWQAFVDPRQLERFWGPVEWPATFTRHDMAVGGQSHYYMTGPDGTLARGWFRFLDIEPQRRIEVEDGFALDDGAPDPAMPVMRMTFHFQETSSGSRFTGVTRFESLEDMERVLELGMEEGMRSAMGQLDRVLADLASFASDRATEAQILSDTLVRISRIIRGTVEEVWRAHHEPELLQRWFLGPDGWTMPVCQVATEVGGSFRYEWEAEDGSGRFGFEGTVLEWEPPSRVVSTEQMIGMEGPPARNEMTLAPVPGGTLLTLIITYPNAEVRDAALGSGMTDGMEAGYRRLEEEVLGTKAA